jgi:hypothetical protein
MDWMTLSIELCGLLILCIWIVIPIREFKQIFTRIRPRENHQERDDER